MIKKNIYEIIEVKTQIEKGEINFNIRDYIKNRIKDGLIIAWFYHKVLFGEIISEKISFYDNEQLDDKDKLIRLRAFNENEEIHLWIKGKKWFFRYARENNSENGNNTEVIDAEQVMFGTRSSNVINGFVKIYEDRGIEYCLPARILNNRKLDEMNRLILKTRNYISYNEIGQASFADSRFMAIYVKEVK